MEPGVCVTGMGLVSPLGLSVEAAWDALIHGRSGIGPVTRFDASALPVRIAGEVRDFRPEDWMDAKEARRNDRFIHFALAAAQMALRDSGIDLSHTDLDRVGVIVGTGMGGLETITDRGHRKVSPFFIPSVIANLAPGQISLRYGLRGPNFAPVSACATGNHALGEAMLLIERGMADVIVAGGAEATITPLGLAGFIASRAMSERNDEPIRASRPFDLGRDGFVPAEGAGVLVLESRAHAKARGARIHAELVGYGASADAYHITSPAPGGEGAQRAMKMALRMAELTPNDVGYVNAHATSTPVGDLAECEAIQMVFAAATRMPLVSATKSMTGHMLGAAGGAEAIFSILALNHGLIPPTINVEQQDPACTLDVVPNVAREHRFDVALSNGFGFGGTNASLVFRRSRL
jgi:3-oxoacyl-[acyl-carrier-protein] synthase II